MIQVWKKFGILFVMAAAVVACNRMEPVYNVNEDATPASTQQRTSSEQVGMVIAKVAADKGWTVEKVKPGLLRCSMKWVNHVANVEITYSKQNYSIELDSSINLNQSGGTIHPKYNELVHELQSEMDRRLAQARAN